MLDMRFEIRTFKKNNFSSQHKDQIGTIKRIGLQEMAKFKIDNLFKITNRGQALTGNIIEGEISAGDLIQFSFAGSLINLEIKSIESVRSKGSDSETGLMLGIVSENIKNALETMIGQNVIILKGH
jgi:GTPase